MLASWNHRSLPPSLRCDSLANHITGSTAGLSSRGSNQQVFMGRPDLLEGGAELLLTELKDEELLELVALDINKALKET